MDSRVRIWCVIAVLALTSGGVAYAKRPATEPTQPPRPSVPAQPTRLPLDAARL